MKKKKVDSLKRILLIVCFIGICVFLSFVIGLAILFNKYKLDETKLTQMNNGVAVYSSTNNLSISNTSRSVVSIESLPEYVKNAFIDTEDKRFSEHKGYDLKRIIKAGFVDIVSRSKSQGASTISQQLIKNALLTNEKTFSRKLQEIILSIKMEKKYDKDQILEMYLNTIYFGSNAYGIDNASKTYFNKSATDLTLNEVCCLAGLIKAPTYYSPITNYENSLNRKNLVAELMFKNKHITERELDSIKEQGIQIATSCNFDSSYEKEAIHEACMLLNITERELINNEYSILTYKDEGLQKSTIEINSDIISSNEASLNTNLDSLSVVANNNGHVLAYYGNSNYDLHNLSRQPASVLKPLAVYLPCITYNILTPASLILDEEINYNGYAPLNADKQFHGYISTRQAIADSLNVPAVKALDFVGIKKAKETLTNLGINISNSDMNLSLALGSVKNGVNLMDLMSSYTTIANLGVKKELSFVKAILDKNGKTVYQHEEFEERVAKEEDCFLLTEMLKETAKTGTAKRMAELNLPIATKTGTANNGTHDTDLYNIAYTPDYTVMTWISNIKDNKIPSEMNSSNQPTEINKQLFKTLYKNKVTQDFKIPNGVKKFGYDTIELELNHRIIAPTQKLERFITYDYFKTENPPEEINVSTDIAPTIKLTDAGAVMNFQAKRNVEYYVYKSVNNEKTLLEKQSITTGEMLEIAYCTVGKGSIHLHCGILVSVITGQGLRSFFKKSCRWGNNFNYYASKASKY